MSTPLRFLLACPACKRQFDAGGLPAGSLFRCACGDKIRVPRLVVRDTAVSRCASCGAPRGASDDGCPHCGSDFTLHERDLHTICPGCMARISDKARFCHGCATPIAPQGRAGEPTEAACPACGNGRTLASRRLGEDAVSVMECQSCGGLWLGRESFQLLAERARAVATTGDLEPQATPETGAASQRGPLYRRCPECRRPMHRRNFARSSQVILDTCKEHGLWFDLHELERVLSWIRGGGEARELRRTQQEQAAPSRLDRVFIDRIERMAGGGASPFREHDDLTVRDNDLLGRVLAALFDG
jgi:Zn-finger nucleic acid-binding protein